MIDNRIIHIAPTVPSTAHHKLIFRKNNCRIINLQYGMVLESIHSVSSFGEIKTWFPEQV